MASSGDRRGGLLTAGAVLCIVAGVFLINNGAVVMANSLNCGPMPDLDSIRPFLPGLWVDYWWTRARIPEASPPVWFMVMGVPLLVPGMLAVVGGVSALKRKSFGLSLAGAICALLSGLLGMLAVVFVSLSRKEFEAKE